MRVPKLSPKRVALLVISLGFALSLHSAESQFRTKITIESATIPDANFNAPCYIVPLDPPKQESLDALQYTKKLAKKLDRLGYIIVEKPEEAKVFIKVDFAQTEPFEADVTLKSRDKVDYSHAASTRNYAATISGGRYAELGNPERMRSTNATGFILGPDGKPIDVGQQEGYEPKVVEGESESKRMILHPTVFQVSAWFFPEDNSSNEPSQLWATTSSLAVPVEEPIESQLKDLSQACLKELAKNLKAPKEISRSRR